ncbi:MAG: S41 family peptidase [Bacteroidales bacterium]
MKKILFLCMLCLPVFMTAQTLRFAGKPSLSPDGRTIYFSYDGDIFTVPAEGGLAMRLVSLGGNENNPKVSPDGKMLAFSSDIQGNNDVYIVPVTGGEVKRLTYHDASDIPSAWSADSKTIYFESGRANMVTTYKIAVEGGTPYRLVPDYFNTMVNVAENPVTKELYFNESSEGISFPTRKRYIGDNNPDIKLWNPVKKEYKQLTTYIGKDLWPMIDKGGNLYYISDESNKEANVVKYTAGGNPKQLTSFKKSIQYPAISFDGSGMVFLLEYKINYLNLKTGKVTEPQITITDNNIVLQRSFEDQKPTTASVSPDGKKFAFAIRGFLFVSDAKCKFLKQLNTPANERVTDAVWSADNKTIYYLRTNKGYNNIYKIAADGSAPEKLIYATPNNIASLVISHKLDKVAFTCGSKEVMLLDMKKDTVEKIADAEFWAFQDYNFSFSFDDSHLAFEAVSRFDRDIYIYSFKEKKLSNLTNSASTEGNPCFSPDGKNLYLVANLYGTSFPRGGGSTKIYKLPLQRYNGKPFQSDVYDSLFVVKADTKVAEAKSAGKKNVKASVEAVQDSSIKIDYTDVFRRMEPLNNLSGRSLYTYENKGQAWLLYSQGREVSVLKISDPQAKPQVIKDLPGGFYIESKNDLYAVSGGDLYKIDLNQMRATKTEVKKSVEKNLQDEFEQMFYQAWATMEQNYYDVKFHGADWKAQRDYYATFLPYVQNRGQLRTLMNDMLGELNSSHQGFSSRGKEEVAPQVSTVTAETGIIWNNDSPYTIDRILTDSPSNSVDIDLQPGDVLVAVNGEKVSQKQNREKYFVSAVRQDEIKLTFRRGTREFDVKLHTISTGSLKNMLYTEWEDVCRAKTEKLGNGRIAYIHMRDMTDNSLPTFLKDMYTYVANKDALILDLRYNNGGNIHNEVLDFLRQKTHFTWSYRDFPHASHPNVTPADKPIIVLVNERSLSDAEVTSNGIKTLGIAKIVGTETYRWIIFTSGTGLIDGSSLRLPAWGCYSLDGKDLEFSGVKPDIYVKNTFQDRVDGKDPQLERAVQEILKELK